MDNGSTSSDGCAHSVTLGPRDTPMPPVAIAVREVIRRPGGGQRRPCHEVLSLNIPFSDEPLTGREAVMEAIQTVHRLTADLTDKAILGSMRTARSPR
jgi:hypothetical protein